MLSIIEFFVGFHIRYLLAFSALFTITGDYFGKVWSINQKPFTFLVALIFYAIGSIFFIPTLSKESLVITTAVWLLLVQLGNLGVGLLLFHEKIDTIQTFGIAFAFVAMLIFAIRH